MESPTDGKKRSYVLRNIRPEDDLYLAAQERYTENLQERHTAVVEQAIAKCLYLSRFEKDQDSVIDYLRILADKRPSLLSAEAVDNLFAVQTSVKKQAAIAVFLERYRSWIEEQETLIRETAERARETVTSYVLRMVRQRLYPATALQGLSRIQDIPVVAVEPFIHKEHYSSQGRYTFGSAIFRRFTEDNDTEKLHHIIVHEYMHALAGQRGRICIEEEREDNENGEEEVTRTSFFIEKERVGLRVRGRGGWLDEAIIESESLKASGYDAQYKGAYRGSEIYIDERKKLDELIQKGLDRRVLLEAHFEENTFVGDTPQGTAYGKVARKISEIEASTGDFGFTRLEYRFALASIRKDWDVCQEFDASSLGEDATAGFSLYCSIGRDDVQESCKGIIPICPLPGTNAADYVEDKKKRIEEYLVSKKRSYPSLLWELREV